MSISLDGKLIATYSLEDNCVRFWQTHGGFLGALVGAFGGSPTPSSSGGSVLLTSMRIFRSFPVGRPLHDVPFSKILEMVKFEWISERGVKIWTLEGLELSFSV